MDERDTRRAWRQWVETSNAWDVRYKAFLQEQRPLPVGSLRGLSRALLARHAKKETLLAQRPVFPTFHPISW
jgi:hypothetical protein